MKIFTENEHAPVSYKFLLHTFRGFKQNGTSDADAAKATADYLQIPVSEVIDTLQLLVSYNIANESEDGVKVYPKPIFEHVLTDNLVLPFFDDFSTSKVFPPVEKVEEEIVDESRE